MRSGYLINALTIYSEGLVKIVCEIGVGGFIRFIRKTICGPWLYLLWVEERLAAPFQLQLK